MLVVNIKLFVSSNKISSTLLIHFLEIFHMCSFILICLMLLKLSFSSLSSRQLAHNNYWLILDWRLAVWKCAVCTAVLEQMTQCAVLWERVWLIIFHFYFLQDCLIGVEAPNYKISYEIGPFHPTTHSSGSSLVREWSVYLVLSHILLRDIAHRGTQTPSNSIRSWQPVHLTALWWRMSQPEIHFKFQIRDLGPRLLDSCCSATNAELLLFQQWGS